ncbi:MAG: glycosyltransferase family 25 protein [Rhizobiaceae bacterium]|nr:glycosyltransferase family 25 protein [Rhizobiaceae bacterium]
MRAVYINLDRSPDRRDWMEAQASNLGISLERFPAVDGSTLASNPFPNVPIGAAGCFLSHRALWSDIAQGNDPYVLVLEDDAHLSPDLRLFLSDRSWIPEDADIVHAERTQKYVMVTGRSRRVLGRKLIKTIGGGTGTGCYVISRQCAQRLVETLTTIDTEFDQILFNQPQPDLTIYKLLPALSIQDKLTSEPFFQLMIERTPEASAIRMNLDYRQKLAREIGRIAKRLWTLRPTKTRATRVEFR